MSMGVHDAVEAWAAGDLSAERAFALTGTATLGELHAVARACGVAVPTFVPDRVTLSELTLRYGDLLRSDPPAEDTGRRWAKMVDPMRSTQAEDYQHVPRAVAVMPKAFAAGSDTGRHEHHRAQLLYAVTGLMVATADVGTWVIPEAHALWIPPGLPHRVTMHGPVEMCTGYLAVEAVADLPSRVGVLQVSPLLSCLLAALAVEPILYDEAGRGGHLAALVLDEIRRAPETPLTLPLPADPRLRKVCVRLVEEPSADLDLDAWAEHAGVSRRTFTRGFREQTGMSFGDWRARARVVRALALAAEGRSLRQLATAVGYRSLPALRARLDDVQIPRTTAFTLSI